MVRWLPLWLVPLAALGPPGGPIQFEPLSLPVRLENHPSPRKYLIETMAGGLAAFDYDGDGRIDLFFTNGATVPALVKQPGKDDNRLFHNEGNFQFRDVTAESGLAGAGYSIGVAAADYDNDGRPDLFVAGVNGNHLYHNDGNGRFTDVTGPSGLTSREWSTGGVWLDYDRDGRLDLFVVNYVKWAAASNPLCTETAKAIPVYCHPDRFEGVSNRLFHNLGNGRFEDVSVNSGSLAGAQMQSGISRSMGKGMSAALIDYDGDGFPDIFVTNDVLPNFLFHNLRNGTFEESAMDAGVALPDSGRAVSAMGIDCRDYDNDGRPDIVFTALPGETFPLFRNLGGGTFQDSTFASRLGPASIRRAGWGVSLADLDNDGWKDLATANSHVTDNIASFSGDVYEMPNSIFRNLHDGKFEDVSAGAGEAFAAHAAHRGLIAADLNGDGLLDLVVTVLGGEPEIWRNSTRNHNHWIAFRLLGKSCNHDGLGVRIRLAGQANVQSSSVSYASSVLGPVHFGLGTLAIIPKAEIDWPDGTTQIMTGLQADRIVTATEP